MVVNRPQGLRDANEKAFMAWFPECAPPTLISRSLKEMRAFQQWVESQPEVDHSVSMADFIEEMNWGGIKALFR